MEYFTISEFIRSENAIKNKIWNGANREQEDNLNALVAAVLDPLRRQFGQPIKVTSGFRCKAVNNSTPGSSVTSQHMYGEAADIVSWTPQAQKSSATRYKENYVLGRLIVALGNFDQIIFENVGKNNLLPEWIHVSWRRTGTNRGNILKKVKGTVTYTQVTRKELGL